MFNLIKSHQQKIALGIGFVAVATLGFLGGKQINKTADINPTVSASSSNTNYTQNQTPVQTTTIQESSGVLNCEGKIKGSSSHKYHLIGGAFYAKTTKPIACFDTEAEAKAAGFVKSSR